MTHRLTKDRPFDFKRKMNAWVRNDKKAKKMLGNIDHVTRRFKSLYSRSYETPISYYFENAGSSQIKKYHRKYFAQKPPAFLFRYIGDLKWIEKTISEDSLKYSRPKCFADKKEVDLHEYISINHETFTKDSVAFFKEKIAELDSATEEDKRTAIHNLDFYHDFYDVLKENTHICCFTEDIRTENPGDEKERWEKKDFSGGAICIDTSKMTDFHSAYYGRRLKIRMNDKRMFKMIMNGSKDKDIDAAYCDIMANMYMLLYKKDKVWKWEKEWRSVIIGLLNNEDPEKPICHDCNNPEHSYYRKEIVGSIAHVIIGENETEEMINKTIESCKMHMIGFCMMRKGYEIMPLKNHEDQCKKCKVKGSVQCTIAK